MTPFFAQIERDLMIAWQNRQDLGVMLAFFFIIITLFPLAIGPNKTILDSLAIPIIWIAALISILAGFDRLFAQDIRDGWLDQVSLSQLGLGWYALAKAISHWLSAGLPLLIMTPIMAVMLNIPASQFPSLLVSMLLGSMSLTLLGVIGASLAEGARRGAALMTLMILPLALPLLIFGSLASQSENGVINPHVMLLGAVFALLLVIAPVVAATALEIDEIETSL